MLIDTKRESFKLFPHARYAVDHDFFKNIDTEEKAYWLGFILADGCVSDNPRRNVFISLKESDQPHLEKFLVSLNSNHRITNFSGTSRVHIFSKKMVEDLINIGVTPRKSLTATPPKIKNKLKRHFWRGVIDGDGSIYLDKRGSIYLSLVGSFNTCNMFKEWSKKIIDSSASVRKNGAIYQIVFSSNKAKKLMEQLYRGASVFLNRKHNLYLEAVC